MSTEEMISELYRTASMHKDDIIGVGETNILLMCNDVAKRLEELNNGINELRSLN